MKFVVLALLTALTACATAPLTDGERAVRVYTKSDPPASCKEVGKVNGRVFVMGDEDAENSLKQATFKAGGDSVRVDSKNGTQLLGTAFKCN